MADPEVTMCLTMAASETVRVEEHMLGLKRFVLIEFDTAEERLNLDVRVGGGLPPDREGLVSMLRMITDLIQTQDGVESS